VAAELRDLTGVDVELMTSGALYPLSGAQDLAAARTRAARPMPAELGVEIVEDSAVADLEPALSPHVRVALLVRGDVRQG
jgi:hypothetical protein